MGVDWLNHPQASSTASLASLGGEISASESPLGPPGTSDIDIALQQNGF